MTQLRDEAEALAAALEIGICGVDEAIEWSDAQIIQEDTPPFALCEVSLSRNRHPQDVAALLRQVAGTPLRSNVSALLTILLRCKLSDHPDRAWDVASGLSSLASNDKIVDAELRWFAFRALDTLELAELGYIEKSREQVIAEMLSALDHTVAQTTVTWSIPLGSHRDS